MQIELYFFFYFDLLFMHQSFESPTAPHSDLSGGWGGGGGLSPQIHSMLVPRKVGNSLELTIFASPTKGISGAVTPWSAVFIFVPHGNIAFITVALIVHILQSALTMTISICQYMYLVSLSQIFLFVIVECTSGPDRFDRRLAHMN